MLQLIKCNKQASKLQDKLDATGSRETETHRDRERWKDQREREREVRQSQLAGCKGVTTLFVTGVICTLK